MIGRLCGVLLEKQAPYLLVDVNGVGYELQAPMTTFFSLPELGQIAILQTHFSVSETSQQLFGFASKKDREFFRLLIKVNGVGPKMAVGIMSIDTDEIVRCVRDNNLDALVKVPGVGKKTAERLIIEMRDKLKSWSYSSDEATRGNGHVPTSSAGQGHIVAEAESALIALGYKPAESAKAVSRVLSEEHTSSEQIIRLALKSMLPA